ncbi:MAG TPA: phenylalanine--tRNA ligase subunit beta [Desulfobacteraceae bacterium]|nr:phenylalanine--tRNA ligase subunit beta [Desulfobacteraceae bacterium]
MKVSLSWLRDYIPVDLDPKDLSDRLTMAGLEVDAVENLYDYLDKVVVGRVDEARQHPNADKLTCCAVDTGAGALAPIVCGAPNVREGMLVACALPGAVLPGDFKIKKSKLRGEPSKGMLCSAAELRLDADAAGIMDLDTDAAPGTPLKDALKLNDAVLEIDLTPNRPDCLSLIGVARETGAFIEPRAKVTVPEAEFPAHRIATESIHDFTRVEIKDPELCPRYTAGMLFDVKVGPSPHWLQARLEAVGLTPINNVVDITNYVMMETGQPLHAFDFDNLAGGKIVVQTAGSEIEFTTLDSKTHKMESEMLMICDGERPVGIAGVMGGENSEISDTTTRVLVESAYFNPVSVRRTAKRTGIGTDASHRFERGVDPEGSLYAMKRAVALMAELCDAKIADGVIDEHPVKHTPVEIDLKTAALNVRLGTDFSADVIAQILESVEFRVEKVDDGRLKVGVPSFRVDVPRHEDLSEEVARLWGYNNIETSYPPVPAKGKVLAPRLILRNKIRQAMTGFSFFEAINYNFIHEASCDRLELSENDARRTVEEILNPISDQMSVLRSTLVPGLLETMRRNTAQQIETLKIFEIGKVFYANGKGEQPTEVEMVGALMTGNRTDQTWFSKPAPLDFFELKGVVQGLLDDLFITGAGYERIDDDTCPYFEAGHAARVVCGGKVVGTLGKIAAGVLKTYGLKQDAFVVEMDMAALQAVMPEAIQAQPLPKFPAISRDMTLIVDKGVAVGAILENIREFAEKQALIEDYFLFDVFEGENIGEGKKSLSFRVVYRSASKTLTEKNIKKIHSLLSGRVLDAFNASLPG